MAELPILPLKTGALLSDTQHMSAEEFGAYCRLLFTMWQHGGKLANAPDEMARVAGVTPQRWAKIGDKVLRPMTVTAELVTQKRLSETWDKVMALRRKRVHGAVQMWSRRRHK